MGVDVGEGPGVTVFVGVGEGPGVAVFVGVGEGPGVAVLVGVARDRVWRARRCGRGSGCGGVVGVLTVWVGTAVLLGDRLIVSVGVGELPGSPGCEGVCDGVDTTTPPAGVSVTSGLQPTPTRAGPAVSKNSTVIW